MCASPLPPVRKPMALARRVSLFEREIRIKLSSAAVDILFDAAEVLSEGQVQGDGYFGSTMITVDLERAAAAVREACDLASAREVAALAVHDPRVRERAIAMATADAQERAGVLLSQVSIDLRARAIGTRVQLDADVEARITRSSHAS
ncbi:MAG: hypothetical protein HY698_20565 [Deltaproteobacteria bacterium]|nr:hypothetical protein [Deltaproteobacteria bacterium]